MQSSDRISSSSNADEVRYEPTNYIITNKEDALDEIKKITLALKEEYTNSNKDLNLFEFGNIHKIENLFYDYKSYAVVKYKLLNIIEDLPKLYNATKGLDNNGLESYLSNNSADIEELYGITYEEEFIDLAKSLSFLENGKVDLSVIDIATVDLDYDNDVLIFEIRVKAENGNIKTYFVRADYYKSNTNQVKPYVKFTASR